MVLSRENIEDLAHSVLSDFQGVSDKLQATNIDCLAADYLNLSVQYATLSKDQSILGITVYAACDIQTLEGTLHVTPHTVLLDTSLRPVPLMDKSRIYRRRFTLAHECAHQILYRYESAVIQVHIKKSYSHRQSFTPHLLKTQEDWNEWQADALGAALLMPASLLYQVWFLFCTGEKLQRYNGWFPPAERNQLNNMSQFLGVSQSALLIRLKQLNLIADKPGSAYCDPLDVIAS